MPTGFQIGPLFVHYYGIILMLGALAGAWLASQVAKQKGYDTEIVWDALVWVMIGGIIGARLWHVFTPPQSMVDQGITAAWYLMHPLDILAVWRGGLGLPGAVIGGAIALFLFCRRNKHDFLALADIAVPGLALGQAIGRWGNFVNQEVYGAPSNLPWAVKIDPAYRLSGFENVETYHPLFLYESLWSLLNMGVLLWLSRKQPEWLKKGDLLLVYLIIYPLGRFLLEFLRLDPARVGLVNINQLLMGLVALIAAGALAWRHLRRPAHETPASPTDKGSNL
ncbi:MAG: prolipoprotein diacylglyceryl transferase [Anaerolineales bacterium]|nr:prolipoprotein diacylglyceryl transferase [Anaerolineales bacterium]